MAETFDVVIIGGGPGGYNCAIRAGQLGLKVACVEGRGTLGGTCLNVGCIPSKALLHASELYEEAGTKFKDLGIDVSPKLNLAKMMEQKDATVNQLTGGIEFLFKKNKVTYIKGWGEIAGPNQVKVKSDDGEQELAAKNIVIATGSEVASLPGVEIDEKKIISSTGALELKKVPKSMAVIGGGVIGLELGSVWRRLGAEVTVIEFMDHILPGMDAEIQKTALRAFKKQKMKFNLGHKAAEIKSSSSGVSVTIEPAKGGDQKSLDVDVVLMAIGRKPYTDGLGLEAVSIERDERGFIPTNHFQTSVPNIWAIGDVTHGPMLAHKAEEDGVAVAELIAGKPGHVDYDLVPGVVYTYPEIAMVGKTEAQLKEAGIQYKTGKFSFIANSRAKANHQTDGMVKFLADAKTDKVLGVHMVGPVVGEMISEVCVLMAFGGSSEDLARTCHAHPTLSEAVRQAAMDVEGWMMQS